MRAARSWPPERRKTSRPAGPRTRANFSKRICGPNCIGSARRESDRLDRSLAGHPWRADEQCRVRTALGHELLRAAVLVVATVEIASRVDAERVHLQIAVRELGRHLPGI